MGSRLGSEVDGSTVAHGQHSLGGAVSSQGKRTTGARGWDKPQALQVGAGGGQRAPQRNRESTRLGVGEARTLGTCSFHENFIRICMSLEFPSENKVPKPHFNLLVVPSTQAPEPKRLL